MANRIKPTYSWHKKSSKTLPTDETQPSECVTFSSHLVGTRKFLEAIVDCRIHLDSDMLTSFYDLDSRLVGQILRHDFNEEGTPYCEHRLFIKK